MAKPKRPRVPRALSGAARRVYGPGTSVRITEHGGVRITDGWGQERLVVVERDAKIAADLATELLRGVGPREGR